MKPLPTDRKEVVLFDVLCFASLFIVEAEAVDCSIRGGINCIEMSHQPQCKPYDPEGRIDKRGKAKLTME